MRAYGLTYDTGFCSGGATTHEPFDADAVARDLRVIREELHCDAVRVTGGVQDRLETAARHAAAVGLEVWYCPFTNGLSRAELLDFLLDGAERAERLRREGAEVVFVTGSEISLFTEGFLPGESPAERAAALADPVRLRELIPGVQAAVRGFFAEVVPQVRARFGGRITYASLPMEGVDWAPFDLVATDAAYRDARTPADHRERLRTQTAGPKPYAVTEFGCTTYRGAAARGGRGEDVVVWGDDARPVGLREPVVRDEGEQAAYVLDSLEWFAEDGVDTAFVNTFIRRDMPASDDPSRDFDLASFGIVKALPAPSGTLTWTPKAAFHALAHYGLTRKTARS
ncbi:hypothetical protein EDD29_4054 [Actinocorallia herbida]|uniref:Abortive infection protein n=1 Tax=Actinocorallia herbida TaxID=58109 RepID=A0A3N1CYW3_9ACTN|nr:hypothetical protein [Actinocorallia herbida]ROO86483.1 hypothetical protein EDD29_4054 [Actinocorallia herbida]